MRDKWFLLKSELIDIKDSDIQIAYEYPHERKKFQQRSTEIKEKINDFKLKTRYFGLISEEIPGLISGEHYTFYPIYLKYKYQDTTIVIVGVSDKKSNNIVDSFKGFSLYDHSMFEESYQWVYLTKFKTNFLQIIATYYTLTKDRQNVLLWCITRGEAYEIYCKMLDIYDTLTNTANLDVIINTFKKKNHLGTDDDEINE